MANDGPPLLGTLQLTRPRRSCFQCVPLWVTIELEVIDRFDAVQSCGERIWVTGTGTPAQKRRIGRNTLLLQMINPGVGGETAETQFSSPGVTVVTDSTDKHFRRISDNMWR